MEERESKALIIKIQFCFVLFVLFPFSKFHFIPRNLSLLQRCDFHPATRKENKNKAQFLSCRKLSSEVQFNPRKASCTYHCMAAKAFPCLRKKNTSHRRAALVILLHYSNHLVFITLINYLPVYFVQLFAFT